MKPINCIFVLTMMLSFGSIHAWAADKDPYHLVDEYGPELKGAPFALRYNFQKTYNKKWSDTTFDERHDYLVEYHEEMAELQQERQARDKEEAQKLKDVQKEEKDKQKAEELKQKAMTQEEKDKQKAEEQAKKDFQKQVKSTQKEIDDLRTAQNAARQRLNVR